MTKYKYIRVSFEKCCILIIKEYGKIDGREISDKHGCAAVIRALFDLRLINNGMYGTINDG